MIMIISNKQIIINICWICYSKPCVFHEEAFECSDNE